MCVCITKEGHLHVCLWHSGQTCCGHLIHKAALILDRKCTSGSTLPDAIHVDQTMALHGMAEKTTFLGMVFQN